VICPSEKMTENSQLINRSFRGKFYA
jgi:hypothetical protein